jgi:hypothetical protein
MNRGLCDPLGKGFELLIKHLAPLSFLLFHLYLVFVTISVLALAITRFVELDI